ncbi:MAG: NADH-quinone oxidoreductase subunit J [Ignavibacteria bacterium]|nr:NADH-quinone oxidoreductase subunit J [Ignavibacteria bacterium]
MEQIIFLILSVIIIVFSVLTVTSRKILRAAVYLLFVLIGSAGLFFMLNFNFLAAVQLTVYAGGIIVLIIFSIMLTSQLNDKLESAGLKKSVFSLIAVSAGAIICLSVIMNYNFPKASGLQPDSSMRNIGLQLLGYKENGYVLPFEVISILLLASMVGSIIIARREKVK